ncbi:hemerythrin domain-containing protein, partial [Parvimonas sp. M13]
MVYDDGKVCREGGGPIAVMEYEHEQAKRFLNRFLEDGFPDYLQSAVEVLLQHFQKEEQVLFPMAQKLLNEEEKQELLEKI